MGLFTLLTSCIFLCLRRSLYHFLCDTLFFSLQWTPQELRWNHFFLKYFCFPLAHFCVHSQCTLFFIRDHKMYCERERKLLKRPPGSIFSFLKVLDQSFFPFQSVPDTLCVLDFVNVTCQISPKTKNKNVS